MKRNNIYKYLYIHSYKLYFILFTVRQLFYFLKGRESFRKFGNRAIGEHFNWDK